MTTPAPEMRLFDQEGRRLYLNQEERARFLKAVEKEDRENRVLCRLLYYTGCRPSEALELTPERIELDRNEIVFRSLKKRTYDQQGRVKPPRFRIVPSPAQLMDELDLVFDLRRGHKTRKARSTPLWSMHRSTVWRMVSRVMERAEIIGPMATPKGLRHGFGVACVLNKIPLHLIRDWLGHSDTKTTEIYTTVIGQDQRDMLMAVWRQDEKSV